VTFRVKVSGSWLDGQQAKIVGRWAQVADEADAMLHHRLRLFDHSLSARLVRNFSQQKISEKFLGF
jgi:hypothetical protein